MLGRAVVDAFLARGDHVVAVGRRLPEEAPSDPRVHAEAADLAVADDVEALWERLERDGRRPRWVVNTTGGYRPGTVADSDPDHVQSVHELNLATVWWSCRAAARRLPAGEAILNVASRSAVGGGRGADAYAIAKAGVARLTEVLAAELAEARIRVNAVLPSVIDTPDRISMSAERMRAAVPPGDVAAVAGSCSRARDPFRPRTRSSRTAPWCSRPLTARAGSTAGCRPRPPSSRPATRRPSTCLRRSPLSARAGTAERLGLVEGFVALPGERLGARLLSVRRDGAHRLLRYELGR